MNRGVTTVIERLKADLPAPHNTRIKNQHGGRGENIVVWSVSSRLRIQDGARDKIDQVIGVEADRPTRAKIDIIADLIQDLLTKGFKVVSGPINADIFYSAMISESVPRQNESKSFSWRGFFDIKGQKV